MITDFEINGQDWLEKDILPEYWSQFKIEKVDGGIAIQATFENEPFQLHGCFKNGFPKGCYIADLNFQNVLDTVYPDPNKYNGGEEDSNGKFWSRYGLCDNPEQVLKKYKNSHYMKNEEPYCILFTPLYREDEPETGGFRYHKWGSYIGKQKPQHEYLYDDKHIDLIYSFHFVKCG